MSETPDLVVMFILDESLSMKGQRDETINGVNAYVNKLKTDHEGEKVLFSLTQFHSSVQIVCVAEPIEDIPPLTKETYCPQAYTALYDAIGQSISELSKRVDQDSDVLFVIMTDGGENQSKEFTLEQIQNLIEEKKKKEWSFVFMGADVTANKVGASLGTQASVQYSSTDMTRTMENIAEGTSAYCFARGQSAQVRSKAYAEAFDQDRNDADKTPDIVSIAKSSGTDVVDALVDIVEKAKE